MSRFVKVSGRRFDLPLTGDPVVSGWNLQPRPGGWIIAESPGGGRRRFFYWEARGLFGANLDGRLFHGEIAEERHNSRRSPEGAGDADLVAQFPGKVRKLLVMAGQWVAAGDPLILVEAMKMEFQIKAPFAGRVERVLVEEGRQLSPGDRFLDLLAEEKPEEPL